MINKRNYLIAGIIFIFTFFIRFLFSENNFFDPDSVGFALGSISYSLSHSAPHMPGYFFHVKLICFLNNITSNPHASALFLTFFYSSAGAGLTFLLLRKYFSEKTSLFTSFFIITNPMVWYYGATTDIYSFELLFSAGAVLLGLSPRFIYWLPVFFAAGMGIRPSSGILLLPLYYFFWRNFRKNGEISKIRFIAFHSAAFLVLASWFIPMALSAGSLEKYFRLFNANSPLPSISFLQNIFQLSSYFFWFASLSFIVILFLFISGKIVPAIKYSAEFYRNNKVFFFWLVLPAAFFIMFHYSKGYFILTAVPLLVWVGALKEKNVISDYIFTAIILLQICIFIFLPAGKNKIEEWLTPSLRNESIAETWITRTFSSYSMTYSRIKEQDKALKEFTRLIDSLYDGNRKNKILFLDPAYYAYARALHYMYPQMRFVILDFYAIDGYIEYSDENIQRKNGLSSILEGSLLITSRYFELNYLKLNGTGKVNSDGFLIVPVDESNYSKIWNLYTKYFVRSRKTL